MKKLGAVVLCLFAVACAPSISPQMQRATDELIASAKAGHNLGAAESFEPMPWAVGQWVMLKTTDSKGQPSITRISVVGSEGEGFWVEQESQDYFRHSITKILYSHMPRSAEDAVDAMQKMVTKADDQAVQTYDFTSSDPAARFAKSMMKSVAQGIVVPTPVDPQTEDAVVAAGTFRGCAKATVKASFGPIVKDTISWFHPGVPINVSVKGVTEDGAWTVELLDFGLTGAQSRLQ